jgi:hypothetical protein
MLAARETVRPTLPVRLSSASAANLTYAQTPKAIRSLVDDSPSGVFASKPHNIAVRERGAHQLTYLVYTGEAGSGAIFQMSIWIFQALPSRT